MEAARYDSAEDNLQYLLNPLLSIQLVNGRELDYPCYNGRYGTPANNSDHSTKSDDLRSINHIQRLQQEPRLTDSVCQGCYEHPAEFEFIE